MEQLVASNGWKVVKGHNRFADESWAAAEHVRPAVRWTPLDRCNWLSNHGEGTAYVKWESMQATGSFKARGAVHKVLGLSAEQLAAGVVTSSTGNHALAVVYACSLMQRRPGEHGPRQPWRQPLAVATGALEATASAAAVASASGRGDETSTSPPLLRPPRVFLAHSAAPHKVARLRSLGAVIVQVGADCVEAELAARSEAEACGAVYISPYNDLQVVGGQGTIGLELLAELGPGRLDAVLVPVGAGGLIAGIASVIKSMAPHVQVIGCQPAVSDVMRQSVAAGRVVEAPSGETLSDATAGGVEPGSITLQPCIDCVDEWLTVTEEEIADALLGMLQHESRLVEGSAACAVAAFLKTRGRWQGKHVVLIACGGNIGLEDLRSVVCGASCSSTAAAN